MTPTMKYLDSLSIVVEEVNGGCLLKLHSVSTNFCPACIPCSWFRCCCDCFRLFQDGGLNQKHVERFVAQLAKEIGEPEEFSILYSSK